MPVFFSLWHYLQQTVRIGVNFLCNSLSHRYKRSLIYAQVFCQSSSKLVQNEKDYSLTLKFQNFCKIFGGSCQTGAPLSRHFSKFFKPVLKQHIATKQQ